VAPQCIGVVEWTILSILMLATYHRLTQLREITQSKAADELLVRMRTLVGYSAATLALEAFGMGMMDFDIVRWHKDFTKLESHNREVMHIYDLTHPFRTDLMTAIYSTGFAFVPRPII
jgi:hypothetical protein